MGKWLGKLAAHFRIELQHDEIEIFLDHLVSWSDYQIAIAFDHCLTECLFFPKLKEVLDRMPEQRAGRSMLCKRCEPDGWVVVPNPHNAEGNIAVRCDHITNYPPARDLKLMYKDAAAAFAEKPKPAPRFPHLIGKGIMYGK